MKQEWTLQQIDSLLSAQAASGLTKKDFLKSRGIHPATFYYWQKRLRDNSAEGFVEVKPAREPYAYVDVHIDGLGWVALRSTDASSLAAAVIALKSAIDA